MIHAGIHLALAKKPVIRLVAWGSLLFAAMANGAHSISVLINPRYHSYASDTLFAVPDTVISKPTLSSQQAIEFTGGLQPSSATFNYLFSAVNQWNDENASETEFTVNELLMSYGGISLENNNWENKNRENNSWEKNYWELTLGRRISSWGVGYGFRPLDVIQQQDQQSTSQQSLVGKNQIALEHISLMSSWSLLWVNPFENETPGGHQRNHERESLVVRYTTNGENHDLHALLRYNTGNRLQLGVGGVTILTDAIAIHASLLLSQHYQKQVHALAGQNRDLLATDEPFITTNYHNGLQSLIGVNWSSASNHNVMMEYWYDDMAYTRQQWKALFDLAKNQRALLYQELNKELYQELDQALATSIYGNIAWSASALGAASLAQHNLMLRWNYNGSDWTPTVNILMSVSDKSDVTTLSATRRYNAVKLEAGLRTFNGSNDSIYGSLILSKIVYLTLSSEF